MIRRVSDRSAPSPSPSSAGAGGGSASIPPTASRRRFLRRSAFAAAGLALTPRGRAVAPARARDLGDSDAALADTLRALYARSGAAWERWGGGPPRVRLPDGRDVTREEAWRDHPRFVVAARRLAGSPSQDDAALGAWLLGSAPAALRDEAARAALDALRDARPLVAFEAALALARLGGASDARALERRTRALPLGPARSAAALALERAGVRAAPLDAGDRLPPSFGRGVCWWYEGLDDDGGAISFDELRALGVTWISIHTWDPLQQAADEPRLARPARLHAPADLGAVVKAAHAAGLRVLFKPHLEMGHPPLSPRERDLLRGGDTPERRALVARLQADWSARGWHGAIEMANERDWRAWFDDYGAYVLDYARRAQAAGCDAFCVGREIDRTVLKREADWRALVAAVRGVFTSALTYSAHHDTFAALRFWDALDAVGVAAYAPLSSAAAPSDAQLAAGARRAVERLAEFSRARRRPVWLTEAGFPALPSAAARPWDEPRGAGPAQPMLQARCWDALLAAVATTPQIGGVFGWLWEGVSRPPFRDASFTLKDKPAAFVLARYYRGLGA
jgi:hypothetical protein